MKTLRPKDKEVASKYIENGGNCTKAVKAVHVELTPGGAKVKASRLLSNVNFWQEINNLSANLGFSVDDAMSLLIQKAQKGDKDSLKALQTWFEVTGNKAPTKQEITQDNTVSITQAEATDFANRAREALKEAHKDYLN